jgi:hypothetical protein
MKYIFFAVSILFSLLIILIYLSAHSEYWSFLRGVPHLDFLFVSFSIYLSFTLIFEILALKLQNLKYTRIFPFLLSLPLNLYLSQYFFLKKIGYWETADIPHMIQLVLNSLGGIFMIFGISLIIGSAILKKREAILSEIPAKTAIGIVVITFYLFWLGYFHQLNAKAISIGLGIMTISAAFLLRKSPLLKWLNSLKNMESPKIIGHLSFWMIGVFIALNFFENLRPIPKGYDGMTIYANLSFLLNEYGALVKGFGAYNYSLFSSLGLILFSKPEFVLLSNFSFYLLFLVTLYFLARKYFSIPVSLLTVASVQAIPMLNRMAFMQQKVESSLLFFSLVLIILFLELMEKKDRSSLLVVGVIAGFLFAIKYPSIVLVLALFSGLWYSRLGLWGLLSITSLTIYFVLVSGIDEFSGLSFYHIESSWLKNTLLICGFSFLAIAYLKLSSTFLDLLKKTMLIGIISFITFIPWGIKHYQEGKSMTVKILLYGKSLSPNER